VTPEKKPRRHSPYVGTKDTVLVEFTLELIPGDSPESLARERKGRPVRTPPPEGPKPDDTPPPA
jgi:hypothetical protein